MAKKSSKTGGKSLVIVESPAKARTISKYLGKGYAVEASIGHIRDLPRGAKEIPAKYKGEEWSYLGVNVNDDFDPVYVIPAEKKSHVTKLRKLLKECSNLYLATDEDREGEAISWHLQEVLKPKVPVQRLVFHEITKEAIQDALSNTRDINEGLVRAQETRRILDRLYGYEVSPLLWRKVGPKLSAGRVQSVAIRLIVERERARCAFVDATYWDLVGTFSVQEADAVDGKGGQFEATLVSVDGQRVPVGKDFDSATGQLKKTELCLMDESQAQALMERLQGVEFRVASLENKPYTTKPAAPFTTSTMQQEANRKMGFTATRTMRVAQSLYENGYITYMRTDSTNLATVAIEAARKLVQSEYGDDFLPDSPRSYTSKVKNAQEAHEAIRPAGDPFMLPEAIRGDLSDDQFRLFELIWKRTIASQMTDARGHRIMITIEGGGATFQVSGRTIDFAGFLRAYVEGSDDPSAELADKETILPAMNLEQQLDCQQLEPKSHTTQPPARYSEASLTRALEERGIGRPSTYAAIIETIIGRDYVFKKNKALVPTWVAFSVVRLLEEHLPDLVDYQFTAQMEDFLDAVSRQEVEHLKYLEQFYFGGDEPGLKKLVADKINDVDPRTVSRFTLGEPTSGEHREEVWIRVGKYGPFIEQGERRASIPDSMTPDELTQERALQLLVEGQLADEPLGFCEETSRPVYLKQGRFGPYIQLGTTDEEQKVKNASLLAGMTLEEMDLVTALKLLGLPRELGAKEKEPVLAHNGRYGPYVKCGTETRSLPAEISPLDVTLEKALELLAQPKRHGRGRAAPKEPLKVFDPSPVTEEPIKLLDGRYGPYVTDGATNASLPRGTTVEELDFDQAVNLLAERAARSPGKKKRKKKAPKKKAAAKKKKTTKKKAAKKKKQPAKKKTPAKKASAEKDATS